MKEITMGNPQLTICASVVALLERLWNGSVRMCASEMEEYERDYIDLCVLLKKTKGVEEREMAYEMIAKIRDRYHGRGERNIAYMMVYHWHRLMDEDEALQMITRFTKIGCWKDMKYLCTYVLDKKTTTTDTKTKTTDKKTKTTDTKTKTTDTKTKTTDKKTKTTDKKTKTTDKKTTRTTNSDLIHPIIEHCVKITIEQLMQDYLLYMKGKSEGNGSEVNKSGISNVAKWIPRENSAYHSIYEKMWKEWMIRNYPYLLAHPKGEKKGRQIYRKWLSTLNVYLGTKEIRETSKEWEKIAVSKITYMSLWKAALTKDQEIEETKNPENQEKTKEDTMKEDNQNQEKTKEDNQNQEKTKEDNQNQEKTKEDNQNQENTKEKKEKQENTKEKQETQENTKEKQETQEKKEKQEKTKENQEKKEKQENTKEKQDRIKAEKKNAYYRNARFHILTKSQCNNTVSLTEYVKKGCEILDAEECDPLQISLINHLWKNQVDSGTKLEGVIPILSIEIDPDEEYTSKVNDRLCGAIGIACMIAQKSKIQNRILCFRNNNMSLLNLTGYPKFLDMLREVRNYVQSAAATESSRSACMCMSKIRDIMVATGTCNILTVILSNHDKHITIDEQVRMKRLLFDTQHIVYWNTSNIQNKYGRIPKMKQIVYLNGTNAKDLKQLNNITASSECGLTVSTETICNYTKKEHEDKKEHKDKKELRMNT